MRMSAEPRTIETTTSPTGNLVTTTDGLRGIFLGPAAVQGLIDELDLLSSRELRSNRERWHGQVFNIAASVAQVEISA